MKKQPLKRSYLKRYVPKQLTKKDKYTQKYNLDKSRKMYKKKKYFTRKKVSSFKSKPSKHLVNVQKIYKINKVVPSVSLAKKTGCSLESLKQIEKKGQGAYFSSGSRPNQSAHSWGRARLASSITGGKSAAVDYLILKKGCKKNSKALKLANKSRKKHNFGQRRVPKIQI